MPSSAHIASKRQSPLESAIFVPPNGLVSGPKLANLATILGSKPSETAGDELLEPKSQARYANMMPSSAHIASKRKYPLESAIFDPPNGLLSGPKLANLAAILGSKPSETVGE